MLKRMIAGLALIGLSAAGFAQETSATLNGHVKDGKGVFVTGATISVKHEPTGSVTTSQTNSKGIFVIPNLKAGGPYTIKISFVGFKEEVLNDVNLALGNNPDLNLDLKSSATVLTEVTVTTAGRKQIPGGLTVGSRQLSTLPTLGRSLSDFTRLTPQSNNNSFAGTNFRYNNLTIDGAVNNDAIGFSNSAGGVSGGGQSGAAGAGTRTNPYSLDVIQEVQVQLAPYDVKLGNFTGGSVNAVTKSGGNNFHGSIYSYGRSQALVGKSVDGLKTKIGSDFYDYQYGATISGPIVKNKAFFIVNFEQTRRQEPTFYNAGDPGAAISIADAQAIQNQLKTKYGYDAGSYDKYTIFTKSDKLFARLDFNLDNKNSLTLRGIYTNGLGNNLERTTTNFQFSSTDFTQHTRNLNLVAELKTKFSNNLNNQFNLSYINVHEYRDFPGALSPFMDIGSGAVWAGTWREASIYNMKQKTFELSDNLTLSSGINKFTFGTHNEFYNLTYGFVNSWNGRWEYSNLANFLGDRPSRIRGAFTTDAKFPNDRTSLYNNPPNPFKVALLSAYVQDEITASPRFKITPGLRVDYSALADQPTIDPALNSVTPNNSATPTYTNTPFSQLNNKWLGKATLSPRIGFNWDITAINLWCSVAVPAFSWAGCRLHGWATRIR
jgi:outer membrane receptor protein involved in Fe transport